MYSHEDLIMSVFNLFGAGTVTTSNTLVFFLLMLARHPDIQGMAAAHSCSCAWGAQGPDGPHPGGSHLGADPNHPLGSPKGGSC